MTWGRLPAVVLAVTLVASCLAAPMASVGAAQSGTASVTIGNVSVSPQTPEPGEQVTITAALQNSESSTGAAEISEASLQGPGLSQRSTADNLGSLGPGDSIEVPFSTSFDSEGEKRLTVVLRGNTPTGSVFVVERPVYVDVERSSGVSLAFSTVHDTGPAADAETPINVTVANGDSEPVTGIQLNLNGTTVDDPTRIKGSIDGGSEHTFQYDVTFDDIGMQSLSSEVTYTTAEGVTRTATASTDMMVEEPEIRADLSARTMDNGDTELELTNFGNTPFTDVEVTATANDSVVAQNLLDDVAPDSNESVAFDIPSAVDGTITYTATYTAAGDSHSTHLRDQSSVTGEIRLVSVDSTPSGTGVTIQGDAANLGSTTAESVLLSIATTENVAPAPPTGEYYVGEIEGSEFGTFELSASVQSNTDSIPVEVTYIVDGERVTTTQEIDVASGAGSAAQSTAAASDDGPPSGQRGSGLPMTTIGTVIALLIVIVAGIGLYHWRSQ